MNPALEPFIPTFDHALIDATRERLAKTRFPEAETVEDWQQGVPLHYCQELVRYWSEDYDWQRVPNQLSRYENFMTEVDGIGIHCLHVRSPHSQAQPLVITHGWPGQSGVSPIHEPLTNPTEYGGTPQTPFTLSYPASPASASPASQPQPVAVSSGSPRCGMN